MAFLDLDNFKPVNDNYGHDTGDYVLVTIANRLKDMMRKCDTLARIGGDEFVLLLHGVSSKEECSTFLNRSIELINTPIELEEFDCHVQVSASIGVALVTNDKLDADTILRRADQTMYQAKNMGSNNILFFDPEEEHRQYARRAMLQAAEKGIANCEFELHYQPQINMVRQELIGVEALIRWNHPTMGFLYPADFSEVLEHPNTGILIGEWVLQEALNQHALWQIKDLVVSVNIAPAHLLSKDFSQRLSLLLQSMPNIDPKALELEILETVSICDINQSGRSGKSLLSTGVHVALRRFWNRIRFIKLFKAIATQHLKNRQGLCSKYFIKQRRPLHC